MTMVSNVQIVGFTTSHFWCRSPYGRVGGVRVSSYTGGSEFGEEKGLMVGQGILVNVGYSLICIYVKVWTWHDVWQWC